MGPCFTKITKRNLRKTVMINKQRKPACGVQKLPMCGKSRTEMLSALSHFNQFVFGLFIYSPK